MTLRLRRSVIELVFSFFWYFTMFLRKVLSKLFIVKCFPKPLLTRMTNEKLFVTCYHDFTTPPWVEDTSNNEIIEVRKSSILFVHFKLADEQITASLRTIFFFLGSRANRAAERKKNLMIFRDLIFHMIFSLWLLIDLCIEKSSFADTAS